MKLVTRYGTYNDCYLTVDRYAADKTPCIQLWNTEDGRIARLTVCLNEKGMDPNMAFVDTNNLPEALGFIREYGLGKETGKFAQSGWCIYPLVEFDMDAVRKYA